MKITPMKIMPLFVALLALAFAKIAVGVGMGSVEWNRANLATLRTLDKTDLVKFLNEQWPGAFTTRQIGQFEWADLAGNGQYRLVLTLSGPCAHFVGIYSRDASGRLSLTQRLPGFANLKTGIRDLNGDGKDELVIGKTLAEYSCASIVTWPAVYRLDNGKYVEASRDFPKFYDDEVLPKLDAEIKQYRAKEVKAGAIDQWNPAGFIMARDKILRVLGRDPTAGLKQANDWMNSSDPQLAFYAAAMFKDIGGHEQDAKAAEVSYRRAKCKRHPGLAMCRAAAPN